MAQKICSTCGCIGYAKVVTPGSLLIEIILWCFLLVPGLIYSLWRHAARKRTGCPKCGNTTMIPVNTPMGQNLVKSLHSEPEKSNADQIVSDINEKYEKKDSVAYKAGAVIGDLVNPKQAKDAPPITKLDDDPSRPSIVRSQCRDCKKVMTYQMNQSGRNVNCPDCKLAFVLP